MITFKKEREADNEYTNNYFVEIQTDSITLDELFEDFKRFLLACSYSVNGNIEVVEFAVILFAVNEFHDIGMINPQDRHVGPPTRAPLFDLFGGGIEDPHE